MADIGVSVSGDTLYLWRGRDFKWNFENLNVNGQPTPFPAGDLYFEFVIGGETMIWPFVIGDGSPNATIKVESTEVDKIPARTPFQLVFLPDGETSGGDPVAWGQTVTLGGAR
ncbi:hypothetical protein SEA_NEDARYA_6 [Gordonia phage Nedarya]|nr:hypothetical protein SEA_NEDARYA_6 [Gordonia phage Nedarya]